MVYLRIDEIFKDKNKTKYWLVKNLEMNYKVVSNMIEKEKISIRFDTIDKLCEVLRCSLGDLFKIDRRRLWNDQKTYWEIK